MTAVLMVDTRPPSIGFPPNIAYQGLTAWLNRRYAHRHGYKFLYHQLSEAGGECRHIHWGVRHPSYCKLPPLAAALERFATVALIDSDSWFSPSAPSLDAILSNSTTTASGYSSSQHATVHFASDAPFGFGPNCGFMVWKASTAASRLLQFWWHLDAGPYARQHEYEQHTLYWAVAHMNAYRGNGNALRTLQQLRPMSLAAPASVTHVDHTRRGERLWRLCLAILNTDASIQLPHVAEATQLLQDAQQRDRPSVQALRTALVRAALAVVNNQQQGQHLGRRRRRRNKRLRRRQARDGATVARARIMNATEVAAELIPPPRATESLAGLTLVLRPCVAHLKRWQEWRMTESWRLHLVGHPNLCLAAGPSTPLREPRNLTLAQLQPCSETATKALASSIRVAHASHAWRLWAQRSSAGSTQDVHGHHSNLLAIDSSVVTAVQVAESGSSIDPDHHSVAVFQRALESVSHERGSNVNESIAVIETSVAPTRSKGATLSMFAGKHGAWRRSHAEPTRLFAACNATLLGGAAPDKAVQDCETWCRPRLKKSHCRKCKCRACRACSADGSAGTTKPGRGAVSKELLTFDGDSPTGDEWRRSDCLSVWHNDGEVDGAPLIFSPCAERGALRRRQQQGWSFEQQETDDDGPRVRGRTGLSFRVRAEGGLCATAFPVFGV